MESLSNSEGGVDYNYLDSLNEQQRAAVEYIDGPSLVIAGAGSGKTRVLTYKIVHLLRSGLEPERILALTFTNKAAREMKARILPLVGAKAAHRLWMGTFHSVFLRILRVHAEKIGFPPEFTIYDASDARSLVKIIIKELELDDKTYKPASVAAAISNAKNALISAADYIADPDFRDADRRARRPETGRIYSIYCARCKAAGVMDFDDILYYMNVLLRDYPEVAREYAEWFRFVLVDEYQDTNFAQHLIIKRLTEVHNNLCAVGDDAQSIYSFRGANIGNILSMESRYPGLRVFKLERNYRSTRNIVNAAGSLIEKNTRQMRKNVFSTNSEGSPVEIFKTYSDLEEAATIAALIAQSKLTCHDSSDDYVILYRTNAQSRTLEEALRRRNMPYRIYGGQSFYQRKEVKDAICYFRLCVNPDDDEALRRIINYPARGIGDTTMKKLQAAATATGRSLWSVMNNPKGSGLELNAGTWRKLNEFVAMISLFVADARKSNAYELGQLVYNRTGMLAILAHDRTPESISRQENLSELLAGLKEFVDLRTEQGEERVDISAFLSEVSLATDQDEKESDSQPKVTLMTVHAAKGLEFKHVYVAGVEEDLFPSAMANGSLNEIEEERRLLYVAITRAEQTCTLTYSGSRFRNGTTVMTRPSRFIADIDRRFVRMQSSVDSISSGQSRYSNPVSNYYSSERKRFNSAGVGAPVSSSAKQRIAIDHDSLEKVETSADGLLKAGVRIRHERFGIGVVRSLERDGSNEMMIVDFGVSGVKKLILKYAKYTIL